MPALAAYFLPQLLLVFRRSGFLLLALLPYILVGAAAAAILKKLPLVRLHKWLSGLPQVWAVPAAALLGIASPLCTLGSVPLVIGFVSMGLPVSAGIAFLAASSVVTPQMVLIAAGVLGWRLAALQAAGGILLGCLAGWGVMVLGRKNITLVRTGLPEAGSSHGRSSRPLAMLFLEQLEYVLFFLLVGVVVSQAVSVFLPLDWVASIAGGNSLAAVAVGALVSVPGYICGGAVIPILGSLHDSGLGAGIILCFLICGPATRIQSFAALGKVLNRRGMAVYVSFILTFSIFFGFAIGFLGLPSGGGPFLD